jgi:nucleoside-diphosphate-sugar epimerase
MSLTGRKILVAGATGQVGFAVARALARDNQVYGLARLAKPGDRERLAQAGVQGSTLPSDRWTRSRAGSRTRARRRSRSPGTS